MLRPRFGVYDAAVRCMVEEITVHLELALNGISNVRGGCFSSVHREFIDWHDIRWIEIKHNGVLVIDLLCPDPRVVVGYAQPTMATAG